jgi:gas vesicle protein
VSKDNSGTVMVAFVLGALAGAAVALLFAPASGEDTREFLGEKAREGRARLKEQRDSVLSAVDRGRDAFTQQRQDGAREHGERV